MASEPKQQEELGEDKISQMPDVVLHRILSLLDDTVLAVQTTILSKRWNNLWTSISCLRFHNYRECDDRYMQLIDRVVSLHDSTDIQRFSLSYLNRGRRDNVLKNDYTRIFRCISTVLEHNVVELDLRLVDGGLSFSNSPFLFPESLFTCETLVVLKVDSNSVSFLSCPTEGNFPSLKVLCIKFSGPDDGSLSKLFTCCPILEDLTICCQQPSDVFLFPLYPRERRLSLDINISAPELKTLRIKLRVYSDSFAYNLFINAPKVENFAVEDDQYGSKFLFENGMSLTNAKLRLGARGGRCSLLLRLVLFAKLSNVEYLSLNARGLKVSFLPVFVNLIRLELTPHGSRSWLVLFGCLKRCPNLKHLFLEYENHESYRRRDEVEWNFFSPPELPTCLVSHLQTISIKGFKGQKDEMEVAGCLLKNGKVLKTMSITVYTVNPRRRMGRSFVHTKDEIYNKLLRYEKGSESCLIRLN